MTIDPILATFNRNNAPASSEDDDPILSTFKRGGGAEPSLGGATHDEDATRVATQGPVERFARGVGSVLDPRQMVRMFTDREESDPRAKVGGAVMDTLRGLSGYDHAARAIEAVRAGDYATAGRLLPGVIPGVGPAVVGAQEDIYGAMESGDIAGGLGKATGIVGSALAPQIGGKVAGAIKGKGGAIANNAETAYKAALSTPETAPLAESIGSQMMSRRMVVSDPAKVARRAGSAADSAATAREAVSPMKATEAGDPVAVARGVERKALGNEAQFQRDIQTVTEALANSGSKTIGNVLVGGAKKMLSGERASLTGSKAIDTVANAAAGVIPGGRLAMRGAKAVASIAPVLKEFAQTPAFKTSAAITKREFGQAMQSGNIERAVNIAAGIVTGQVADEFGHRAAIERLSAELDPLQMPELRRQALGAKKGYYTDPDGKVTQIPVGVMTALMDAKNVSAEDSPVAQWLGAMQRQKQLKGGGTLTFDHQGAEKRIGLGSQWPADANAKDENHDFLMKNLIPNTEDVLPQRFRNSREIVWGAPISGRIPGTEHLPADTVAAGLYGYRFDPREPIRRDPRNPNFRDYSNTAMITEMANDAPAAQAHEVGHGISFKDLTEYERGQWRAIVDTAMADLRREIAEANIDPRSPDATERVLAIARRYPKAIVFYASQKGNIEPGYEYEEPFAEMWGQFMANPTSFEKAYPGLYNWFVTTSGVDYRGGKMRTVDDKPAWERPGGLNRK